MTDIIQKQCDEWPCYSPCDLAKDIQDGYGNRISFTFPDWSKHSHDRVIKSAWELSSIGDAHEHGNGEIQEEKDNPLKQVGGIALQVDQVEIAVGEESGAKVLEEDDDEHVKIPIQHNGFGFRDVAINHW